MYSTVLFINLHGIRFDHRSSALSSKYSFHFHYTHIFFKTPYTVEHSSMKAVVI